MYKYYNPNPLGQRTGDCVIRAICKALNKTWDEVYILLCLEGFCFKDWGNTNAVWDAFLRKQGFKRYTISNTCPNCYTISDFAHDHPAGTYILATGTHLVTIRDEIIYDLFDSSDEVPIFYYHKKERY